MHPLKALGDDLFMSLPASHDPGCFLFLLWWQNLISLHLHIAFFLACLFMFYPLLELQILTNYIC